MAYRLSRTRVYESERSTLSRNAQVALGFVEDGIADDPRHRFRRYHRPDGVIVDWSAERLLVAFRVIDHEIVELLAVIDLM